MVVRANRLLAALYTCPLPVVGAVNGHAIAAGLVMALACDLRVAVSCGNLALDQVAMGHTGRMVALQHAWT